MEFGLNIEKNKNLLCEKLESIIESIQAFTYNDIFIYNPNANLEDNYVSALKVILQKDKNFSLNLYSQSNVNDFWKFIELYYNNLSINVRERGPLEKYLNFLSEIKDFYDSFQSKVTFMIMLFLNSKSDACYPKGGVMSLLEAKKLIADFKLKVDISKDDLKRIKEEDFFELIIDYFLKIEDKVLTILGRKRQELNSYGLYIEMTEKISNVDAYSKYINFKYDTNLTLEDNYLKVIKAFSYRIDEQIQSMSLELSLPSLGELSSSLNLYSDKSLCDFWKSFDVVYNYDSSFTSFLYDVKHLCTVPRRKIRFMLMLFLSSKSSEFYPSGGILSQVKARKIIEEFKNKIEVPIEYISLFNEDDFFDLIEMYFAEIEFRALTIARSKQLITSNEIRV